MRCTRTRTSTQLLLLLSGARAHAHTTAVEVGILVREVAGAFTFSHQTSAQQTDIGPEGPQYKITPWTMLRPVLRPPSSCFSKHTIIHLPQHEGFFLGT